MLMIINNYLIFAAAILCFSSIEKEGFGSLLKKGWVKKERDVCRMS